MSFSIRKQRKPSITEQLEMLEEQENVIKQELQSFQDIPLVNVNYLKPVDIEPQILRKNLFSTKTETSTAVAQRLNASHIEPLAEIVKKMSAVVQKLKEIEDQLLRAREQVGKYNDLTYGLKPYQIQTLETQAKQFRQENK